MKRVLIVSGWIGSREVFSDVLKEFSNSNIRFIDFKGITLKEDILEIVGGNIKEYNPDIIIAWSMGTLAVLKILECFESKSRLILISPTTNFTNREYGWSQLTIDSMMKLIKIDERLVLKKFCRNMLCKGEEKYTDEVIKSILVNKKNININDLLNALLFLKYESVSSIRKIKNETLIIHGEEDFICSIKGAEYIKGKMKNSILKVIDKCGHIPFITKKEEFINIMNRFLNGGIYD